MRHKCEIAAAVFVLLLTAISQNFAQEAVTFEALKAQINLVENKMAGRPFRSERTIENFSDGSLTSSAKEVYEYISKDRNKRHSIRVNDSGDTYTRDFIRLGKWEYNREDDDDWTKEEHVDDDPYTPPADETSYCSEYYIQSLVADGRPVRILGGLKIYSENVALKFIEFRNWINDDGLMYKTETVFGYLNPRRVTYHQVDTRENDPKDIKIEAPIK